MSAAYRADHRGKLFNFFWPFTRYLFTMLAVTFGAAYLFLLNRFRVIGRSNVPDRPNTLLLSNHQSMLDSFPIGIGAYYPQGWWKPYLLPWNPAASENFYRTPILAWIGDQLKCIPVRPGRRDLKALHRSMEALREATMILFPEGTRSRDGEVKRGRPGAGLMILGTKPTVIPVAIDGMRNVMPIGTPIPRPFKRITISYGEPFDYSAYLGRPRSKETAQELVDEIMDAIRRQLDEIRAGADQDDVRQRIVSDMTEKPRTGEGT